MNQYYVYIMTNAVHTVLYIGMTNDIKRRVYEHKNGLIEGFTKKYKLHKLIYVEMYTQVQEAIMREKQLKHWNREWKEKLIKNINPLWRDLYHDC